MSLNSPTQSEPPRRKKSNFSQQLSAMVAVVASISTLGMIASWMNGTDEEESYLGGLNWDELIFNWHPILMVAGFVLSFIFALSSFRLLPFGSFINKLVHSTFHVAAIVCFSTGLYAVFTGNNFTNKNNGQFYANLFSLHSFIGLSAVAVYSLNFLFGFSIFLYPGLSKANRKAYLPVHIRAGLLALFLVFAAVETGIMELTTEYQCGYEVTSPDTNPAENYHLLTDGCKLANGAGIVVLIAVISAAYAIIDVRFEAESATSSDDEENEADSAKVPLAKADRIHDQYDANLSRKSRY